MDFDSPEFAQLVGGACGDITEISNTELGAYVRMVRWYRMRETPLPGALESVYRIAMATTPDEQRAVASILERFFTLAGVRNVGGDVVRVWRHAGLDASIATTRARGVVAVTRARKAAAKRWQAAPGQAHLPGFDPPAGPVDNSAIAAPPHATSIAQASVFDATDHAPSMRNRESKAFSILPAAEPTAGAEPPPPLRRQGIETTAERLCAQLLAEGVTVTPSDAHVARWLAAGHTECDVAAAARIARQYIATPQRISVRYLDRVLASERAKRTRGKH